MSTFNHLPFNVCDNYDIEQFPVQQDCTNYPLRQSQICGVVCLPTGATLPSDWTTIEGWAGVIDNTDTSGTKARYLVGIGSFLPAEKNVVSLAGGRAEYISERRWQLLFDVLNMNDGHLYFGIMLQGGFKSFNVWIETRGGRMIGGPNGMAPFLVDADTPFGRGENDKERLVIDMAFFFPTLSVDNNP